MCRIFVQDVAAKVNGIINGVWIDLDIFEHPSDVIGEINVMLAESPVPGAEEWEIVDWEDFGPWNPEGATIEEICSVARGVSEHGINFCYFIDNVGLSEMESYEEAFYGEFKSVSEFAHQYLEDSGEIISANLAPYIDYEFLGRDLLQSDFWGVSNEYSQLIVFRNV